MAFAAAALPKHRRLAAEDIVLPPGRATTGTRGTILSVALHQFAERGYGGTSVRDLATAAGVQPATIYAHFPSKEHVLAELIRIGHEEHYSRVRRAAIEAESNPPAQLAALMRAHVRFHAEFSMLAMVANAELHVLSTELGAAARELRHQTEQSIRDVVERGVKRKLFDVPDVWLAVAAIGGIGLRVANWYGPAAAVGVDELADVYALFALRIVNAA